MLAKRGSNNAGAMIAKCGVWLYNVSEPVWWMIQVGAVPIVKPARGSMRTR